MTRALILNLVVNHANALTIPIQKYVAVLYESSCELFFLLFIAVVLELRFQIKYIKSKISQLRGLS